MSGLWLRVLKVFTANPKSRLFNTIAGNHQDRHAFWLINEATLLPALLNETARFSILIELLMVCRTLFYKLAFL